MVFCSDEAHDNSLHTSSTVGTVPLASHSLFLACTLGYSSASRRTLPERSSLFSIVEQFRGLVNQRAITHRQESGSTSADAIFGWLSISPHDLFTALVAKLPSLWLPREIRKSAGCQRCPTCAKCSSSEKSDPWLAYPFPITLGLLESAGGCGAT